MNPRGRLADGIVLALAGSAVYRLFTMEQPPEYIALPRGAYGSVTEIARVAGALTAVFAVQSAVFRVLTPAALLLPAVFLAQCAAVDIPVHTVGHSYLALSENAVTAFQLLVALLGLCLPRRIGTAVSAALSVVVFKGVSWEALLVVVVTHGMYRLLVESVQPNDAYTFAGLAGLAMLQFGRLVHGGGDGMGMTESVMALCFGLSLIAALVVLATGRLCVYVAMLVVLIDRLYAVFVGGKGFVLWLGSFLIADEKRSMLFLVMAGVTIFFFLAVIFEHTGESPTSSPAWRKAFHLYVAVVLSPAYVMDRDFACVATCCTFCFLMVLEAARATGALPFLQPFYARFMAAQDDGYLCMTPLALLIGSALPVWLGVDDWAVRFCGLVTIAVGDSLASLVGRAWGRLHYPFGNKKTVEGTVAGVLGTCAALYSLALVGGCEATWRMGAAAVAAFLFEASSPQIDNVTVPLVFWVCYVLLGALI